MFSQHLRFDCAREDSCKLYNVDYTEIWKSNKMFCASRLLKDENPWNMRNIQAELQSAVPTSAANGTGFGFPIIP